MKKLLFMLLALVLCVGANAQEPQTVYDITVTAQDDISDIWLVVGEENLANVEELTLSGTINGYDIMIIRDKMPNLHKIDMENVRIVANNYKYFSNLSTEDDIFGSCFFYELTNLREVKLPSTITLIGSNALGGTANNRMNITSIIIPEGVEGIDTSAFSFGNLTNVVFPTTLQFIGINCFSSNNLEELDFSRCRNLTTVYSGAFVRNPSVRTIRIPENVRTLQGSAFDTEFFGTYSLADVYVQTILPRPIPNGLFGSVGNVRLHVPPMTYYNYYWATGWSAFGTIVEDVNPDFFYVDSDLIIAEDKVDANTVDADVEANGGIINEDTETQAFDELNVVNDGINSGSLIANDNITVNNLCFNINVTGNRWHFFSFPFRINLSNVEAPGSFVFRRYDGAKRALDGSSGWSALENNTEYLEPGVGYIFQCNKSGTLKIQVASPDFNWGSGKNNGLTAYQSAVSDQHASWNFVGNPLTCYYDIDDLNYDSPLTIWDGSKYVAYRPGDDNYQLHPFEAFFLQKPEGSNGPTYEQTSRMTYTQATNHHDNKAAAARRMAPAKRDRHLLNLVLSNGTDMDQTRVVFNENTKKDYEMECDAAKFMSSEQVPQLFSVYAKTRYAINERPQGEVMLGYTAPVAGSYTLSAERMDMPVVVKDLVMGTTHDLNNGEYTFETEAGTFENRFVLMPIDVVTAVNDLQTDGAEAESVYSLDGKQLPASAKGVNIVRKGNEVQKIISK